MAAKKPKTFSDEAAGRQKGALGEFVAFAFQNKKWWLTPVIVLLLVASALIILGGTGVAPFIYSIF
jgi:Family of unknown function (DUF5989)